jgi:7,8-dihydro-6-hydroxymethylpterin dimethyltransferase
MTERDYLFVEQTTSLCPECLKAISAKVIEKDKKIYLLKYCIEHGESEELLEEDSDYYIHRRKYDKPGTKTCTQTEVRDGCPHDCGLCPQHEQHSCNALIEVTDTCDLGCPLCYANSGEGKFLDLETLERMMDFFQESEDGKAEILQISGGEPTTHPDILKIMEIAKSKNFRYIMLNTNGLRIAKDEEFVKTLSKFRGRFEIYLQFDGFSSETYKKLRGRDLLEIKMKAIENLRKYKIPVTLVATIQKGLNDSEIGKIVNFGMETDGIRGVNFQPVAFFGRVNGKDTKNRITMTGIINEIENQTETFQKGDIVPLPCNIDRVAVSYLYKSKKGFVPLTRQFKIQNYLEIIDNTFAFDADKILQDKKKTMFSGGILCDCMKGLLSNISSIVPKNYSSMNDDEKQEHWDKNLFRISVTSFLDAYNFEMHAMKKECVHMITPDLKRIPFSAYNIIHRNKYK